MAPKHSSYDVVIIGGAMMGASVAWHLSVGDFQGRILVVERDPSYEFASTSHSNSCMRQQFSTEVNIRISQYGAEFVRDFRDHMCDHNAPKLPVHHFGYMYLADNDAYAARLQKSQRLQAQLGAGTRIMAPGEIAEAFPFYDLEGIVLGSFNQRDEGYFDGNTMFDWWRRKARENGVEFVADEVVDIGCAGGRVENVVLKSGTVLACGVVVNAAGPRAARVALMAGLEIPVEPRKRYTYVFDAENPLDRDLPLTVDPSGVHVRTDGANYMAGAAPDNDPAVEPDDFGFDHGLWEAKVWPAIAVRIPAFEAIKVINSWVGHYAYNRLDQNAIVGRQPDLDGFIFVNGFSGHGFQQAPAMGRGVAELIEFAGYRTLDMSELGVERVLSGHGLRERAVI